MNETEKNIKKFAQMIENEIGIKVFQSFESRYGGWCNFYFNELYSDDMIKLGNFINKHFSTPGAFTERCLRLVVSPENRLSLVVIAQRLNDFMKNGKITDIRCYPTS
jgi:hypothetical protein